MMRSKKITTIRRKIQYSKIVDCIYDSTQKLVSFRLKHAVLLVADNSYEEETKPLLWVKPCCDSALNLY